MPTNSFLPFAADSDANVMSDADYAASLASTGAYAKGVTTGLANSKQANKTWRQATLMAASLAQFLVNTLNIDVTDSNSMATLAANVSNAVLALSQVSPYNKSFAVAVGGYRKGALVSNGSGGFWVSTADNNLTVPGASGANWSDLFSGMASQSWANSQFIINNGGVAQGITRAAIDGGSQTPSFLTGAGTWIPVASYSQLVSETNRATTVESNLQSSKYDKTGGTLTGTVTVEGNTGGVIVQYNPGSPSSGTFVNYPGFVSVAEGRGGEFHVQVQENVGTKFIGLFSLRGSNGDWRYMSLPEGSRINDSAYGDVAYVNDLGSYVPTTTYVNDFSTSDSRVINLPYGHRIQFFTITVPSNNTNSHRITYPVAFSGASSVTFVGNDTGQSRSVSLSNNTTPDSTGFDISVSVHGNSTAGSTDQVTLSVIAIGPK